MKIFGLNRSTARSGLRALTATALVVALTACAQSPSKPVSNTSAAPDPGGSQGSGKVGQYKVGSPYQIGGVWYYPAEDLDYREDGVASWYGPDFHGKLTANGETYDMNDLTAAHRTLPMPSIVRVTNLENNRALVLRVNDRGPFAKDRILDVSRRAAQLLDFHQQGTTRVRVEILADESMAAKAQAIQGSGDMPVVQTAPRGRVAAESLDTPPAASSVGGGNSGRAAVASAAPPPPAPVPARSSSSSSSGGFTLIEPANAAEPAPAPVPVPVQTASAAPAGGGAWVQAGSFSSLDNAQKLQGRLQAYGPVAITPVMVQGQEWYRVRLGPLRDAAEAQRTLDAVKASGLTGARVVND